MGVGPRSERNVGIVIVMSLFGALSSATSGLRVIQGQIQLVSDNVARSDDPNRTRHVLEQTVDKTGSVTIAQYSRQIDRALRAQYESTIAEEAGAQTTATFMRRIMDMMGASANGKPPLIAAVEGFQKAWTDLDATPESTVAQGQVVQFGEAMAREIRRISQGVEDMDARLRIEIQENVTRLNDALAEIDRLNVDVIRLRSVGEPSMNQEDQRDKLVREVAELTSVRVVERSDGRLSLFTPTGLALIDAGPARLSYQNGRLVSASSNTPIDSHMQEGRLGALLEMVSDGSLTDPPTPASRTPSAEIIRKLRSQLDALAGAFTAPTRPGEPTSFADAYDAGEPEAGELRSQFFTGTTRFSITINENLLTGEVAIKQDAIARTTAAMTDVGRSLTADGVTITNTTYVGMTTTIVANWGNGTKSAEDHAKLAADFKAQLQSRYQSSTGVNLDEEIATLQILQRNYSASARVMQVINTMFDALEGIVR